MVKPVAGFGIACSTGKSDSWLSFSMNSLSGGKIKPTSEFIGVWLQLLLITNGFVNVIVPCSKYCTK